MQHQFLSSGRCRNAVHEVYEMQPRKNAILRQRHFEVSVTHCEHTSMPEISRMNRLNVKLGGVNTIPDPRSTSILSDPSNPTVVMGAFMSP